jgi:lipoprotein-anchoring transpeptidase ErfK/SrfK
MTFLRRFSPGRSCWRTRFDPVNRHITRYRQATRYAVPPGNASPAYAPQAYAANQTDPRDGPIDPKFLRQEVAYPGREAPGTIIVDTANKFLYLIEDGGRFMPGGTDNPLGARALYLGSSLYRIHGSNEPWTIGTNVSSGCIRMRNEDVTDLYQRVKVGTKVVVI